MGRKARVLSEGLYFGEGPRWRDGRLWFSDFYARAVKSVSPVGDVRIEMTLDDDAPSGLGWTPDGALLIVSMAKRQVLAWRPGGAVTVHADLGGVATFMSNDMVVDAGGGAYVGDFGFDLHAELLRRGDPSVFADHPTTRLARVAPDGAVSVAADAMHFPNGSAITPDGRTLIVGETLAARLTAFDIGPDGALSGRRVWAPTWPRAPDGLCLDAEGAVWIANPLAHECVRIGEGGTALDIVATSQNAYACMLGGKDGRTLFVMTAPTSVPRHAAAAPRGRIEIATVDQPHAGRP
ncbi:sugar lactone lactonase YvrE [Roseiarcus fermentans]|uniref:Sugar lactone lactonase YvrE n=1 Tax=Roseiarcus fermentans TaxID=1473586 RepID=A0A366ENT7_9HYPH|nr:SMP-30/gluconolactonase/LRE family protein [Roseiarcus fermentans]RBP04082.1 sugar lactone lactonase YvrE [Roseiarcus fermentans]